MEAIDEKYEVLEPLREGGMGAIYKVRHRLLDEIRVVKVMRPHASQDPELRRRFLQEAKIAIRVRHPNIGQLYDFSMDEAGTAVIVMEFIDGVTLQDVLRGGPPPSLPMTIEIAVQTLQALGCLHFNGIVHRDVASDNIMISRSFDGRPVAKLIDLGIAKDPQGDATTTGMFIGKARYASPEQFRGERTDRPTPATDLYSFGVLLYEMLTGRHPFEGSGFAELASAHLFRPPTPFETSDPEGRIPPGLRRVVLQAIEKDPGNRIATAEAFAEGIRPYGGAIPREAGELERLLSRVRPAAPSAAPRVAGRAGALRGSAQAARARAARAEAVLDALVAPIPDPAIVDVLEVVHGVRGEARPVEPAPGPRPPEPVRRPTPEPARQVPSLPPQALRPAESGVSRVPMPDEAEEEEREDYEQDEQTYVPRPARRAPRWLPSRAPGREPDRRLLPWMIAAAGVVLMTLLGLAIWRLAPGADPLAGQIEAARLLPEETEKAVADKLERVAALVALLPSGDDRREAVERQRERLVNLRELHVVVDRLANLLRSADDSAAGAGAAARTAADAENLWTLAREYRDLLPAADRAADRVMSRGREALRRIGEHTASERLGSLAEEH